MDTLPLDVQAPADLPEKTQSFSEELRSGITDEFAGLTLKSPGDAPASSSSTSVPKQPRKDAPGVVEQPKLTQAQSLNQHSSQN